MYDHTKQYRCTIIRGKSQREIDNLLPAYANIIDMVCPCKTADFPQQFNAKLKKYLKNDNEKTLSNHRTEIAGKLLGMYYEIDSMIYISERTTKFLVEHDQPAFFKDFCYKMQFPNGMSKPQTIQEHINNKINIRPYSFILKVLVLAEVAQLLLTKKDIGYYILNSLDVLQGNAKPDEVLKQILKDKTNSTERIIHTVEKKTSYDYQHIIEQINYLELANLIIIENGQNVCLNKNEKIAIEFIAQNYSAKPMFDMYSFGLSTRAEREKLIVQWGIEFALSCDKDNIFKTSTVALDIPIPMQDDEEFKIDTATLDKTQIGKEGERLVFSLEKKRVKKFDRRLAGKVVYLGEITGLGYDIQSVIALSGVPHPENTKFIEVKSTKRVTPPDLSNTSFEDTVYITKNEWDAACQYRDSYSIYRVYFYRSGFIIFAIDNVFKKYEDKIISVMPHTYRVDFSSQAISDKISTTPGGTNV
jgi:hypothetical protein